MSVLTNKHNLPRPLVNALLKREYSRGDSIMSVTQLINSPQIVALQRKHAHEAEDDVADRFFAFLGTIMHKILEDGADREHLSEERLFVEIDGWRISGQIDIQKLEGDTVSITDWKMTSAWNVMNPKEDWEHQLNLYAWLVTKVKGTKVTEASVTAIIRDWRKSEFQKKGAPYPEAPMVNIPIKLWSFEEQERYVRERIKLHQQNMAASDWGDNLTPCTDEDRWLRTVTRGPKKGLQEAIRCENDYCGVARWCRQYNEGTT